MLEVHKRVMIDDGPFSTKCILYSPDGKIQGAASELAEDEPEFNAEDTLKCFCPYIGVDVNTDTGLGIFANRAEITINMSSVKIGIIEKGWMIDVWFPTLGAWKKFKCENVACDRMIGVYLIRPSLVSGDKCSENFTDMKIGGLNEFNI